MRLWTLFGPLSAFGLAGAAPCNILLLCCFCLLLCHFIDTLLEQPAYAQLAPRLQVSHCFGASNAPADAASRNYTNALAAIGSALGVVPG